MKKTLLFFLIVGLMNPVFGKSRYSFYKPNTHGKVEKIQIKGKDRTYYRLDKGNPLEFTVEGAAEFKMLTRLDMDNFKKSKKVDYKVFCEIDGKKTHYTRSAVWSKGVEFAKGGGRFGTAETFTIKLKPGKHKVKLSLANDDDKRIYVRLLEKDQKVKQETERVAMHPQKFTQMVKILVKEREFDYYRVGNKDSVELKVIGPATIKVITRLEYNITMNGDKKYRIAVHEDGKLKNTFLISTDLSEAAMYTKDKAETKLSRGDEFFIEVPAGEHIYTFKVEDSNRNVLLKFYLPAEAMKNKMR